MNRAIVLNAVQPAKNDPVAKVEPCTYYVTAEGCRNGDQCNFVMVTNAILNATVKNLRYGSDNHA